ncbi:hypothetical protein T492DRAFT_898547 [Pavlovales sp. CCMP2436]|nr:hypothetical protein T492DRAFT_898547 [Pavlovales sp. CCMP2436]
MHSTPMSAPTQGTDTVKALEVLSNTLVRQLGAEIADGFYTMISQAEEVVSEAHGTDADVLSTIAEALAAVPQWNQTLINDETARITTNKPWLPAINAATCVAGTQVLFSIRPPGFDNEERAAFDLKAPDMSIVVHQSYMNLSKILQCLATKRNAKLVDRQQLRDVLDSPQLLRRVCCEAVRDAVDETIPVNDIIQYLMGSDIKHLIASMNQQMNARTLPPATDSLAEVVDESLVIAAAAPALEDPPPKAEGRSEDDDEDDCSEADDDEKGEAGRDGQSERASDDRSDDRSDVGSEDDDRSERGRGDDGEGGERGRGDDDEGGGDRDRDRDRERDGDRDRERHGSPSGSFGDEIYRHPRSGRSSIAVRRRL